MRALDIAVENNYIAEIYVQDKARVKESGKVIMQSLYGMTYSVSDWIEMCGYDSSCGLVHKTLKPVSEDALFIRVINELGAMPLFRSSVGQNSGGQENCFTKETSNSIWGRALNPHKKEFSTGGGCGGEAALVGTFSVGIGFGVDLFGDSRYPASCCGVSAFKPSSKRISDIGVTFIDKKPLWPAVISPIARSVQDIKYFLKSLWDSKLLSKYDLSVLPMKFNNSIFEEQKKLVVGFYFSDGLVEPCQANKQAILMTKQALEQLGHTCVEFKSGLNMAQAVVLGYKLACSGGQLNASKDALQGEKFVEEMEKIYNQAQLSNSFKEKLISIIEQLKQDRMAIVMEVTKQITPELFVELYTEYQTFIRDFTDYWISMKFDVIIGPAGPLPAIPHKFSSELFCLNSYFMLFNMLDFPAGVLPIKVVTNEDLKEMNGQLQLSRNNSTQRKKVAPSSGYDFQKNFGINKDRIQEFMRIAQVDSQGLPVGVQIVSLPNEDEKCLYAMEIIEKAISFNELSLAYMY